METNNGKVTCMEQLIGINGQFGRMMALSLLFHVIASLPFLYPHYGSLSRSAIAYLDLNMEMSGHPVLPAPPMNPAKPNVTVKAQAPESLPTTPHTELDKFRENAQKSLESAAAEPARVQGASLGLSITSGYFASIGEGETLRDDIREYYFEMLRSINEKWWVNKDNHLTGRKSAVFYLVIARNGTIVDRMLVESSGNPAYDKAMLKTLEAANPLPPLPETYRGDFFQAPLRFNAPLNLMDSLKIG
jgi:periplasmic protein TonB